MGVRTEQIRRVVCDRCGSTEDTGTLEGRNVWGETYIKYSGHTGGRAYDGAGGGLSHRGDAWLCLECTQAFLNFMGGKAAPAPSPKGGSDAQT